MLIRVHEYSLMCVFFGRTYQKERFLTLRLILEYTCTGEQFNFNRTVRMLMADLSGATSLRKHTYSNMLRILPSKHETFQMKNSASFHISA